MLAAPHKLLSLAIITIISGQIYANTDATLPQPTQLDTIVVTASGFEQEIKNAPASITVIDSEQLQQKGVANLAEALSDVPGVDIRNGQGKTGGLNIQIRGMGSAYTLILIDGQRQNAAGDIAPNGFGEYSTSFMPPISMIERIEVIRGPMSTLYGSDALGGVINIITKKVGHEFSGSVNLERTIQENSDIGDAWKTSLGLNAPLLKDKLGLQLRGEFYHRDESDRLVEPTVALSAGTQGRDARTVEANNYSAGAKLSYIINDRWSTWLDLATSEQRYDNSDSRLGEQYSYRNSRISGVNTYLDELKFLRDQISAGLDADLGFAQWKTFASYIETENEGRRLSAGNAPAYGYYSDGTQLREIKSEDLTIDSRLITSWRNHKLTAGLEYKDNETTDGAAGDNAFTNDSWSIFAEDEWRIFNNLALTLGARYEDHDAFGGHFTPRGYLVWNTTPFWTIKGGVSTGYKVPTANQLADGINGFSSQGRSVTLGNPDLEPEESTNYEIGFNFNNQKNLDINATAFFTDFENAIVSGATVYENCLWASRPAGESAAADCMTVGDFSYQENFSFSGNADEAESYGVELSLRYDILDSLNIKANYTWQKSEITKGSNKGDALNNTPKHAANVTTTWLVTDKLSTWLETEYKSKRTRLTNISDSDDQLEADATGNELKGYTLFNLGASYQVHPQVKLTARVNNLLDKDFGEYRSYVDSSGETINAFLYAKTSNATSGTYIPDRNYWFALSYNF